MASKDANAALARSMVSAVIKGVADDFGRDTPEFALWEEACNGWYTHVGQVETQSKPLPSSMTGEVQRVLKGQAMSVASVACPEGDPALLSIPHCLTVEGQDQPVPSSVHILPWVPSNSVHVKVPFESQLPAGLRAVSAEGNKQNFTLNTLKSLKQQTTLHPLPSQARQTGKQSLLLTLLVSTPRSSTLPTATR